MCGPFLLALMAALSVMNFLAYDPMRILDVSDSLTYHSRAKP